MTLVAAFRSAAPHLRGPPPSELRSSRPGFSAASRPRPRRRSLMVSRWRDRSRRSPPTCVSAEHCRAARTTGSTRHLQAAINLERLEPPRAGPTRWSQNATTAAERRRRRRQTAPLGGERGDRAHGRSRETRAPSATSRSCPGCAGRSSATATRRAPGRSHDHGCTASTGRCSTSRATPSLETQVLVSWPGSLRARATSRSSTRHADLELSRGRAPGRGGGPAPSAPISVREAQRAPSGRRARAT